MTTAAFRDLLDQVADRMARCGTNVERPTNIVNDQPSRSRAVWNPGLLQEDRDYLRRSLWNPSRTEEDREYLRRWQSEMESFDRF